MIALTGVTGFIGRRLAAELPERGFPVRYLLQRPTSELPERGGAVIGDISHSRNMSAALAGVDCVIHTAAIGPMTGAPADDYRRLNTEGTIALARAAERAGVRRFIFLSSIRAQTGPSADRILREDDEARPVDDYGRSKLAAERGLQTLTIDWIALRPVVVYGPGARGSVDRLMRISKSYLPLPVASVTKRHSLLALDNLVDAVEVAIRHPGTIRRPYIVADDDSLTLAQMVAAIRRARGRAPMIFALPAPALLASLRILRQSALAERILGSLVVDNSQLKAIGWSPKVASAEGLAALARAPGA